MSVIEGVECEGVMALAFDCRGYRIEVWHALRGDVADETIGECRHHRHHREATTIWIDPTVPVGTPKWNAILVHEAVHAAGFILHATGGSLDPREQDLPYLVDEIVETVLARIGEVERDFHYDETFHEQGDRLLGHDGADAEMRRELGLDDDDGELEDDDEP